MFQFLKRLFSADAEITALKKEIETLTAQRDSAAAEKTKWEARFFREVNSNRRREDDYARIIREQAKAHGQIAERAGEEETANATETNEQPNLFAIDEEGVLYIAEQFRAQNPEAYADGESFEALCAKIRANPEAFM